MIVSDSEIDQLKRHLDRCWGDAYSSHVAEQEWCHDFIGKHPHLLMPLGFPELRVFERGVDDLTDLERRFRLRSGYFASSKRRTIYRHANGRWYVLGSIGWPGDPLPFGESDESLEGAPRIQFLAEGANEDLVVPIDAPVAALSALPDGHLVERSLVVLPRFPSPLVAAGDTELAGSARELIRAVQESGLVEVSLTPGDLEDIVAELMRARGHRVDQTKQTRDGGRDLIVTGEFVPGCLARMAVEVTTMSVVGIQKVALAQQRNRHFPLIMVATSGRFSAGVVRELQAPDAEMRLQLVDGAELGQWIGDYV